MKLHLPFSARNSVRVLRRINGGWVAAVPDKRTHVRVWATPVQVSVRKHRHVSEGVA